ncbi:MAG TPA: ribonuclease III [Oscillospiraceae bacterium]|nr:ribonuclease III [Oscillospiraceae bacterium]
MKKADFQAIFTLLQIEPKEWQLYQQALTHSSYAHEHDLGSHAYNERLEFLGDAVLELAVSEELYRRYPQLPEGKLTRFRAGLVCEDTLYRLANKLELGNYLRLGKGEAANGGRQRPSLLADAFEAVLGAIYLDLGFAQAKAAVQKQFAPLYGDLQQGSLPFDYKTLMQEYTQAKMAATPEYRIVAETGPDHDKVFVAQVMIKEKVLGKGSGHSKKEAEQEAARVAYERIKKDKS